MRYTFHKPSLAVLFSVAIVFQALSQNTTLVVDSDKPLYVIQPTMWGVFFEDINFGADGGLYAELVKNRSFEFAEPLMGWTVSKYDRFSNNDQSGTIAVINQGGEEAPNPRVARITVKSTNPFSITNEGFHGMGIKEGVAYHLSFDANVLDGSTEVLAELLDINNQPIGNAKIKLDGQGWKKYKASFNATATEQKAKLRLSFLGKGVTDIDFISLFPSDTWKNRPGGLRADLVQLLYDLKPGFLRFPGGCIVEGRDLSQRYQWKKTVGEPASRELLINRWNKEFAHRPAPDYYQTFGLGFYEYFQLAEDLEAEPLPILSCGMACQFNTAEMVPLDQIDPYVQDALDLIEFANGATTTQWGKLRADMGHPQPFNLKMIGVGNEQWGPEYIKRYKVFASAIKSKYPDIKIISGTGPFPDGEMFDYAAAELKSLDADIVDEHYYRAPDWFLKNATRYDNYDRKGPKIFAGEYASQSVAIASPQNKNNWQGALSEAAFMTGLERNADVVHLASYAPLFAHAEGWQWTPDLIWFNNLSAYGTPNYYVQKLFSTNSGTHALSIKQDGENVVAKIDLYASAVWDARTKEIIVKVVNSANENKTLNIALSGRHRISDKAVVTVLASDPSSMNSFEDPAKITPRVKSVKVQKSTVALTLDPNSFTVLKLKTN